MYAKELAKALIDYIEAATAEKAAREKYDGYEWGYHGYSLISEKSLAAEHFVSELSALIDARIAASRENERE